MKQSPADNIPALWVTALAGDTLCADWLATLSERQGLPVAAVLLAEGSSLGPAVRERFSDTSVQEMFPPSLDAGAYWSALLARAADVPGPVFVVRAGTAVPRGGWRRLEEYAGHGRIVFPLAVRNHLSSAFAAPDHKPGLDVDAVDRWLNRHARGIAVDLPVPGGFSGLLWAGDAADPQQFVLSDSLYVDDSVLAVEPLPDDFIPAYGEAFTLRHPLTGARHALTELSSRGEEPGGEVPRTLPVRLHVSHGWGGGLARWIEDFCAADSDARSLVLRPIGDRSAYGQTLALYDAARPELPLRTCTLAMPIVSSDVAHAEYAAFLQDIIDDFGVGSLFVSSLIGHSLDLLRTGLPTVAVAHDFFPTCPAVIATFDGPCESCSPARLEQCLAENPRQQFFRVEGAAHWHAVRAAFARTVDARHLQFVAPSASVAARLALLEDNRRAERFRIIPHGLPESIAAGLEDVREVPPRGATRPLIAVLGSAEPHKGAALLPQLCTALADCCDFLLLGFGDALDEMPRLDNVSAVARYDRNALHALLADQRPDLGLLLSTVPETFSFTLSELQAAGIPTVATRIGALAERIVHGVDGWLVSPDVDEVAAQLRVLATDREAVGKVRAELLARAPRTAAAMVGDYLALLSPRERFAALRPQQPVPAASHAREGALLIDPEARFAEALGDFFAYARRKAAHSPRLPGPLRRLAQKLRR